MPKKKVKRVEDSFLLNLESPLVVRDSWDSEKLNQFQKVFTWNDDYVDEKKYIKVNYTYLFPKNLEFKRRRSKLCVTISGNKLSNYKNELYSKRIEAIRWFEENAPNDFDLYGVGWDRRAFSSILRGVKRVPRLHKLIPFMKYPSFCGVVDKKKETLEKYNFAICYENITGLNGYITEKIFDCFFAGTIPIYWGASNVTEHIPEQCFIDKRKFSTHSQLYEFIENMTEDDIEEYRVCIRKFLLSERSAPFRAETFSHTIATEILKVRNYV
ncbi:glycosyltransferase family 10 domain-containing protein [Halobacteriovorax marinus]|uniref:glycosyltransferase family 10 domain-containing protein n=1 Tax=Halobacteriovorax marinus TaxID=97084 RepID=UPI003A941D27